MTGPIEQAIEIKGHNGFLLLNGRHAVGTAHVIRDKRVDAMATREHALIHRQNHHILKIQATRLEQTHNLQTLQRLTGEGHNGR